MPILLQVAYIAFSSLFIGWTACSLVYSKTLNKVQVQQIAYTEHHLADRSASLSPQESAARLTQLDDERRELISSMSKQSLYNTTVGLILISLSLLTYVLHYVLLAYSPRYVDYCRRQKELSLLSRFRPAATPPSS